MTAPSCLLRKVTTVLPLWAHFVLLLTPTKNRYGSLWSTWDLKAWLGTAQGAFHAAADKGELLKATVISFSRAPELKR